MKKSGYLVFLLGILFVIVGCSKEEGEQLSEEDIARQEQDAEYNKLKAVLVGTWEAYEHYSYNHVTRPDGWRPISEISWNTGYTFNSDGTYVEKSNIGDKKGTYRLEKNPSYLTNKSRPKVHLFMKLDGLSESTYALDLDENGYLRIILLVILEKYPSSDRIPSPSAGGSAAIRYKKK